MAHYKENFDLDEADIELIEDTLRNEIRSLTAQKESEKVKQLNMLLGKLHNQKIWYSQVNNTGVPLG